MTKVIKNRLPQGYTFYKVDEEAHQILMKHNAFGEYCDICQTCTKEVYYIPAKHLAYCNSCVNKWFRNIVADEDELSNEIYNINSFEELLNVLKIHLIDRT